MGDAEGLVWGIKNGDLSELENQIKQSNGAIVKQSFKSRYLLHHAADYGQVECIRVLLDKGADINQTDDFGITPLLAAIYEDHVACVELLLSRGADKTGKSPNGESYIDCASSDAVKKLLKK